MAERPAAVDPQITICGRPHWGPKSQDADGFVFHQANALVMTDPWPSRDNMLAPLVVPMAAHLATRTMEQVHQNTPNN